MGIPASLVYIIRGDSCCGDSLQRIMYLEHIWSSFVPFIFRGLAIIAEFNFASEHTSWNLSRSSEKIVREANSCYFLFPLQL